LKRGLSVVPFLAPAHGQAVLFAGALAASLFFNGANVHAFALAWVFLLTAFVVECWRAYARGLTAVRSPVTLALLGFLFWVALGVAWSVVPYVTAINFWWVGSLAFVFLLYPLTEDKNRFWRSAFAVFVLIAVGVAAHALIQMAVQHTEMRSLFLNRNSLATFLNFATIPLSAWFITRPYRIPKAPLSSSFRRKPESRLINNFLDSGFRRNDEGNQLSFWVAGAILFLLFFVFFLLRSRATAASLIVALALVVALLWRQKSARALSALAVILVVAFIGANLMWAGGVVERYSTALNPTLVSQDARALIWERSWAMLQDVPWHGIGLGTYWLPWPAYRAPLDDTGGFYVHNDYLQLWIETGWVGLSAWLLVYAAVACLAWQFFRQRRMNPAARIEATGVLAALGACAAHSFVDFNLYTMPILLAAGLYLARFTDVAARSLKIKPLAWQPSVHLRRWLYRALVASVGFLLLLYFASLGVSSVLSQRAGAHALQSDLRAADSAYRWAERLTPNIDVTYTLHAALMFDATRSLSPDETEHRKALAQEALALLQEAQTHNPYRAQTYFLRGEIYRTVAAAWLADAPARAMEAYQTALAREPRLTPARTAYAQTLLTQGKRKEARELLEAGIGQWYPAEPRLVPYLRLTAELREQAGDEAGACELHQRIAEIGNEVASRLTPVPSLPLR
jgi:O-antigen ligase